MPGYGVLWLKYPQARQPFLHELDSNESCLYEANVVMHPLLYLPSLGGYNHAHDLIKHVCVLNVQ